MDNQTLVSPTVSSIPYHLLDPLPSPRSLTVSQCLHAVGLLCLAFIR